jgi:NTP pyrophosphatase (non-canonical NTP hydrolase)
MPRTKDIASIPVATENEDVRAGLTVAPARLAADREQGSGGGFMDGQLSGGGFMDGQLTIRGLQQIIKAKDFHPDNKQGYFLKLIEEIGELSEVIRKESRMRDGGIKGAIEEELYDVLYYTLALANVYDIDLERCHELKDEINRRKYDA